MSESNVMKRILVKGSHLLATLFRNNVGVGWVGKPIRVTKSTMMLVQPEDVLVKNARPLHAGLCSGSSDIIGYMSVAVTPPMIGRKIAVFVALEVKENAKPTPEQINFIERARTAGAIAGIVHSPEEAEALINQTLQKA